MEAYLGIIRKILNEGVMKKNRTGTSALTLAGVMFEHDMADGFPLLTTKKMPFKLVASELEFFIRGITDKRWLQERNNHIWDEWCSPLKVPYGHDDKTKKMMMDEPDLGPVYGWQWRNFGAGYEGCNKPPQGKGVDQLEALVKKLKEDPSDRRLIVSAWNPVDLDKMALPACHYGFQAVVTAKKINLLWNQRSVDSALGLPFNIASYGLLLHLLAREARLGEGRLVGFLGDTHIYEDHVEGLKEQLARKPYVLPKVRTDNFKSIFDWKYSDSVVEGYECHPAIKFRIAV